uniref:AtnCHH1 preproprotein n=1 Tax=Athanas nitescens TaxID=1129407 RepID=A0A2Z1U3X2_9EUCA|nr:AtnCHH1 preproprotein [Athanas nitescens]
MVPKNLIWLVTLASTALILLAPNAFLVEARSSNGLSRINKLLRSPLDTSPSVGLVGDKNLAVDKRAVMDLSCKGIYDRELFKKLDRVCEDCYNIYRKPYIGVECRKSCYGNLIFMQCLDDLLMNDVMDEYIGIVQMVGK